MKEPARLGQSGSDSVTRLLMEAGRDEAPSNERVRRMLGAVAGTGVALSAHAAMAGAPLAASAAQSAIGITVVAKWLGLGALAGMIVSAGAAQVLPVGPSDASETPAVPAGPARPAQQRGTRLIRLPRRNGPCPERLPRRRTTTVRHIEFRRAAPGLRAKIALDCGPRLDRRVGRAREGQRLGASSRRERRVAGNARVARGGRGTRARKGGAQPRRCGRSAGHRAQLSHSLPAGAARARSRLHRDGGAVLHRKPEASARARGTARARHQAERRARARDL